jgi:phosphatidylserine/phosphatidylglycerophosphate/cardiolipin synthase-like enzyme
MAKFLNTSATTYHLEELIKTAKERLYIISPYLRFNERIKELLEDKDRMKMDVRIIYGKSELAPAEINWLKSLNYVRTSFCQNLHAKCYLNEHAAIITSMNLYDFSQVNNNEMGVYINRASEPELYDDTYEEALRLNRISDEIRLSAEKVEDSPKKVGDSPKKVAEKSSDGYEKLTTSKLAKHLGMTTSDLNDLLVNRGLVRRMGDDFKLTTAGEKAGGESRYSKSFGAYFIWPKDLPL